MSSTKNNIISENQFTDKVATRYVFSYGHIPYIGNETIDYEFKLPLQQTVLIERLVDQKRSHDIYFQTCIFNKKVRIEDYTGLLYFDNCHFIDYVDFTDTKFHNKLRFRNCTFEEEVYFNNTTFNDLSDFWRCTFIKRTIFLKTDFLATSVFSGTIFQENALFTYSQINKLLILRGTKFVKGLDLSLANITGELKLFDIRLNDFESVDEVPDTIDFEIGVMENGIIYTPNKRETFRLIKHNFISSNDTVTSQKYSLLESITHRKEIWYEIRREYNKINIKESWKRLKRNFRKLYYSLSSSKLSQNIWDYILLSLNRLSNNHKTSYIRGFLFTFILGLFIFIFVAWSTKTYSPSSNFDEFNFGLAVSHFVQFLIPTHAFNYIEKSPPGQFYLLDFLGRIIVAYGIYQTIQAFRKFK